MRYARSAALLALAGLALAGCGASDHSNRIAEKIGATSCAKSGFYVKNDLNGSKQTIYDCQRNGRDICVTDPGGIPRDATPLVRLYFQGVLDSERPSCLG